MTRALQHSLYSVAVFFILTQDFIFALVSENQKYQVYYDGDWKPVPLLAATNASTLTRSPLRRYGLIPCECADLQCGCCANTNFFSTQRSGCMNMTYDPQEFSIGMNMLWNGESVYQNSISAKNPPPACMEAPIPYLPSIQFCIKLFDIYTPGRNIHMCINFETRVARAPILVLEFDCVQMGADGINHVKFNTTQSSTIEEIASESQDANAAFEVIRSSTTSCTTENQESSVRNTATITENSTSLNKSSTANFTENSTSTYFAKSTGFQTENSASFGITAYNSTENLESYQGQSPVPASGSQATTDRAT